MSNYKLAILEPYLPLKHGVLDKKHHVLYGHYLILDTISLKEFYQNIDNINTDIQNINSVYNTYIDKLEYEMNIENAHPIIRNYKNIIRNSNPFTIQIIKPNTISIGNCEWDEYSVSINKTHWLRLVQRRWKEIYRKRLQQKMNIKNVKYREIHGKWPSTCDIKFTLGI